MNIALGMQFLAQLNTLPEKVRGKVLEFFEKLNADPKSPGINYEVVNGSHRRSLHSVRIDQDYRAIVGRPGGDVYMLLWVDKHDAAYKWAEGRACEVNPQTGTMQVYQTVERTRIVEVPQYVAQAAPLFVKLSDAQLLRIGVPQEQLSDVRAVHSDAELERLLPSLSAELSEPLTMLAAGFTYDEVLQQLDYAPEPGLVDTSDVLQALKRPETRKSFHVVENESELNEMMLNASLEAWRIFLHPTQRKIVERDWNGPVRVLGGAGTGKTVVAMHRAKWLLENRLVEPRQKILFTTFTRNLADDIRENIDRLVPAHRDRIEVLNLDSWLSRFFKARFPRWNIVFPSDRSEAWGLALAHRSPELDFDEAFYRDEWEQVVLAQGVTSESEYLRARRVGRGTTLNAAQRKLVWPVFGQYRSLLESRHQIESEDAMRMAAQALEHEAGDQTYASVIVDESQDLGFQAFRLIRALAGPEHPNDILLVGDPHQRIYGRQARLSACGIRITGRGRKLRVNYRTTEEIRKVAVSLLKGEEFDDLDSGKDDLRGDHSLVHGPDPDRIDVTDFGDAMKAIGEWLSQWDAPRACVVARTTEYRDQVAARLKQMGLNPRILDRTEDGSGSHHGVNVATMHRVKGLEFDQVVIAGLKPGVCPLPHPPGLDKLAVRHWDAQEKALLYVALTRARKAALMVGEMGG